jgi:hypothetical protein
MGKPRRRNGSGLDKKTRAFYCNAIRTLQKGDVRFLVGGAYAFSWYTGIERHTKDFDIFVQPEDCEQALRTLAAAGYRTEFTHPHWLGKAYCGDTFVDVIYSSGNGVAIVDDLWFEHAAEATLLDLPLKLIPAEEMIWSKSFIMERERYDGADVAHLLRACARDLDWRRLLWRFDNHWRVLYGHLVLFGYIYPGERDLLLYHMMHDLARRLERELDHPPTDEKVCRGTLISREQYLEDIGPWGYKDERIEDGVKSPADVERWTDAIASK